MTRPFAAAALLMSCTLSDPCIFDHAAYRVQQQVISGNCGVIGDAVWVPADATCSLTVVPPGGSCGPITVVSECQRGHATWVLDPTDDGYEGTLEMWGVDGCRGTYRVHLSQL